MNSKSFLTSDERIALRNQLRKERDSRLNDRIKCILHLDDGWTYERISEALFLDESTIGRYKSTYLNGGIEELIRLDYKGRFTHLSKAQQADLKEYLLCNHHSSAASVADYVQKKWQIKYTDRGMRSLLNRLDFRYKKPEQIPAKINLEAQQKFIDELSLEEGIILHIDAVHPQHNSKPSYAWLPKGKKVGLLSNTGRHRMNMIKQHFFCKF